MSNNTRPQSSSQQNTRSADGPARRWDVFAISPPHREGGDPWWDRVGAAFQNRDGSINVRLRCVPLTGELQLRDPKPREDDR